MGEADNGLTLQGLAQRLEALERENAELRDEVTALSGSDARRDEIPALRSSGTHRGEEPASKLSEFERRVSRRQLLGKAGAAAVVGTVAAGALMLGDTRQAEASPSRWTTDTPDRGAVEGFNTNSNGYGVWGDSNIGVRGTSNGGGSGVVGEGRTGVLGFSHTDGWNALWGRHTTNGRGVAGDSAQGVGVWGESSAPNLGAIEGHNDGGGTGVVGVGKVGMLAFSHTDGWNALWGRHTGNGRAVVGDSARGYGGEFKGAKAQLRLAPNGTDGPPTTGAHSKGELYMDSGGALFVCVNGGNPGAWRKFSTTAV